MRRRNNFMGSSRMLSLSAMFTAMTIVVLYLSVVFPNLKITFYFLSSVFIMGILTEQRVLPAVLSYIAASLLALILLPIGYALPYVLLFGHYGIAKFLLEEKCSGVSAFVAKLIYFDVFLAAVYFSVCYTGLMPLGGVMEKLPIWAWALIAQPLFFVYDFLFSKVTVFYVNSIRSSFVRH